MTLRLFGIQVNNLMLYIVFDLGLNPLKVNMLSSLSLIVSHPHARNVSAEVLNPSVPLLFRI